MDPAKIDLSEYQNRTDPKSKIYDEIHAVVIGT